MQNESPEEERSVMMVVHDHLPSFVEKFPELVRAMCRLHDTDKLMQAFTALQEIECSLEYHQALWDSLTPHNQNAVDWLHNEWMKHEDRAQRIRKETAEIRALLSELQTDDGWKLVSSNSGVRAMYRHESSTPIHSFRVEGVIQAPALNMLAILNEHDLYHTWFPLVPVKVDLVKQVTTFRKVLHCQARLPWPLAPREAFILGYGVDMLEEDATVVLIRDCTEDDIEPHLVPPCNKPYKRVETRCAGFLFKPISHSETHVTIMLNGNPKFSHMPFYIINWAAKVVLKAAWTALENKACNLEGTQFEMAMQQNEELYREMKKREEEYWQNKGCRQQAANHSTV